MALDPKKTLFLIDGSSFLYRAYYGMRPLHTSKGLPVQAVYSFCRMIKKLIEGFRPEHIVLVWDSKGKTTRHDMYEEYKATREAPPSDLFEQKEKIIEFADLIGLAQLQQSGIEADDLMYSLAVDWVKDGGKAVVITSDKDMGQMLSADISMFDAFKDKLYDQAAFEEKMGFPVSKLPFYFSLLGDTSDNIPGVRGIGKKMAFELVQQFDSLQDLYARLDDVEKKRARTALEENKDNAFLSRDLFLLQYIKTATTKDEIAFDAGLWQKALPLFQELEFKSLVREIKGSGTLVSLEQKLEKLKKYDFKLVTTQEQLDELCAALENKKIFALDTETNGVRALQCELVGISFCVEDNQAYYVPCAHNTGEEHLDRQTVIAQLKPILENEAYEKYFHNAKFDMLVFAHHGITIKGPIFDSFVAASLLTPDWQRVGLKDLALLYFDEHMISFQDAVKQRKLKDFSFVDLELATSYSANDSLQTWRLAEKYKKELKEEKLDCLYYDLENPVLLVLFKMEREGIYLDTQKLNQLGVQVKKEIDLAYTQLVSLVPEKYKAINLNSPKQVEELLFYELQLPPQKKSAKRTGYSTDQEVLKILSFKHPVPGLILKYRELYKLKSTYIDALPEYVNPYTKRIHTTFSQTRVPTGRLSSSDPNLQNIPADSSGYGAQIRAAFEPKEGNFFVSADYSQIELRVLAYLSQDPTLKKAFLAGRDIHAQTAAGLFDVSIDEVSHEQRQVGKRINFSILYGLTPYGLSKDLGIPLKEAREYIEKYFAQYPRVLVWMKHIVEQTKKYGYVKTLAGRKRYIPAINEKNKMLYEEACRVAINTVAQGTAAEIMKKGMIALDALFVSKKMDAQILLQIHDELLVSADANSAQEAEKIIKKTLEQVVDWDVPLVATTRIGEDWLEVSK